MKNSSAEAKRILKQSYAIDALFHGLFTDPPFDCAPGRTIVDILLEGGVTAISTTIVDDNYPSSFTDCCKAIHQYYLLEETLPEKVIIATKSADIEQAKREGKLAVIMSTQGAFCFEQDLRYISLLNRLGLKIVQLTYNQQCHIGSGAFETHDNGLSRFGQQCIYEMNRVGMLIDLSHVGRRTCLEAIETSADPVILSHSSCYNVAKHTRNANDEQIKALASKGGVICLCPHSVMCNEDQSTWPTVDRYIDHMVHVAELVGVDYIGIGTDRWKRPTLDYLMGRVEFERTCPNWFGKFDGNQKHVQGFNYFDEWDSLADHMLARGFCENEIQKVFGGNLMRVFQQVWDKK